MSYQMEFHIEFSNRPISYRALLEEFLAYGWTADNMVGAVQYYVLDDAGDSVPKTAPLPQLAAVLDQLSACEAREEFFAVELTWQRSDVGLWFGCYTAVREEDQLSLSYVGRRQILDNAAPITDHNWYLRHVMEPLLRAGCIVARLRWREGP